MTGKTNASEFEVACPSVGVFDRHNGFRRDRSSDESPPRTQDSDRERPPMAPRDTASPRPWTRSIRACVSTGHANPPKPLRGVAARSIALSRQPLRVRASLSHTLTMLSRSSAVASLFGAAAAIMVVCAWPGSVWGGTTSSKIFVR